MLNEFSYYSRTSKLIALNKRREEKIRNNNKGFNQIFACVSVKCKTVCSSNHDKPLKQLNISSMRERIFVDRSPVWIQSMQRLPPSLDKVALRCNSSWSISNSLIASLLVQYVSNLDIVATSKLHNKRMAMEQVLCLYKVKCGVCIPETLVLIFLQHLACQADACRVGFKLIKSVYHIS